MTLTDVPVASSIVDATAADPPWWRSRPIVTVVGFLALLLGVATLYGLLPPWDRSFPLATLSGAAGWVECLDDGQLPCTYVGYPEGADMNLATTIFVGAYLLTRLGMGVATSVNILAVLIVGAGIGAMWALVGSITRNAAAGALAAALYYAAPSVVTHAPLMSLWFGFAFLPVPIACAYAAARAANGRSRLALMWPVVTLLAFLIVVYIEPYAWAICVVVSAPILFIAGLRAARQRRWFALGCVAATLVATALPGVLFRISEPNATLAVGSPLGIYRALGVDVGTALLPTEDSLLFDAVGISADPWDRREFYGDGSQLDGAFLGLFLIAASGYGLVRLLKRKETRAVAVALATAGATCFALGLGPSLKMLDRANAPVGSPDGRFTFADYLMPASEATASLPWSWVYGIQPFEGMRATYRWHVGLRVVLVALAAVAVVAIFQRWRVVAIALGAVLMLEASTHTLLNAQPRAHQDRVAVQRFEDDMHSAFSERLQPSEKVLFLPAGNDYLIFGIAPRFEVFSYNIAGDREIARLQPMQPRRVVDALRAFAQGTLERDAVCELFRQDLIDALVLLDFDLRWDASSWPPSPRRRSERRAHSMSLGILDDPAFTVDSGDLATIVRVNREASSARSC